MSSIRLDKELTLEPIAARAWVEDRIVFVELTDRELLYFLPADLKD
ncbi:MAG: hypothetical protein WBV81_10145 [Ignavibacteriaceae bacterium]